MSPLEIVLSALVGLALFFLIFRLVAGIRERVIQKLDEKQGLEKRSGPRRLHLKLTRYVGQKNGWRSGLRAIKPGELVLTKQTLTLVFPMPLAIAGTDLSNVTVTKGGDRLTVVTERPLDATGRVEVSFGCEDADDWVARLTARGAKA